MFNLQIPVTLETLRAIDAEVALRAPKVPAALRRQAIARGHGYETAGSLREAASLSPPVVATIQGGPFAACLKEGGHEVAGQVLYLAVARRAVQLVQAKMPQITAFGFGGGKQSPKPGADRETSDDRQARFGIEQAKLTTASGLTHFLHALAFLTPFAPASKFYASAGSYQLKHLAEARPCSYPEGSPLGSGYIENGAFIAAAVHRGFEWRHHEGKGSPNLIFKMAVSPPNPDKVYPA